MARPDDQPMRSRAAHIDATTLRFLVTGTSAAGFFFVLSASLVGAGLPPFGGTLLAYAVTVGLTYTAQQAWTFRGRARHLEAFPRYLAVQVGCGLLSALLARTLVGLFGLPPLPMAAITTVASSAVSYLLSRYWVFAAARSR
jgi:putative flippase GtrA